MYDLYRRDFHSTPASTAMILSRASKVQKKQLRDNQWGISRQQLKEYARQYDTHLSDTDDHKRM